MQFKIEIIQPTKLLSGVYVKRQETKMLPNLLESFDYKDIYPHFDDSTPISESDLELAFSQKQIHVFFQPIVSLKEKQVFQFESLIRWKHPKLGYIRPHQFLQKASLLGYDIPMGHFVLQNAIQHFTRWYKEGFDTIKMNVNLNANQFYDEGFLAVLDQLMAEIPSDIQFLELEITENTLLQDLPKAEKILFALEQRNISVALDDFGQGLVSLSCLTKGQIQTLKLDIDLIQKTSYSNLTSAFVKGILQLAHSLNIKVVAEGVEKAEHLNFLKSNHCDEAQGYYFAEPMDSNSATQYLTKQKLLGCYSY